MTSFKKPIGHFQKKILANIPRGQAIQISDLIDRFRKPSDSNGYINFTDHGHVISAIKKMQKRGLLVVTNPNNAEKTKELYVELAANHQTNSINEFITLEANKMTKAKYPPKKKEKIDVKKPMTKKQKKALEVIQQNPGITIAEIRKAMKIQTTEVNSLLLGLESHGVLLSEIDRHIAIMGKEPEYDPAYVSPRA